MGHRKDTTAGNGNHYTITRATPHKRSKSRVYADSGYDPTAGLAIEGPTGRPQRRATNTNNNQRNGGGSMRYNWKEGLAG